MFARLGFHSVKCENAYALMARRVISCLAYLAVLATLCSVLLGQSSRHTHARKPPEYTFKIIRTFPHDPSAFTQGLAFRNGFFYEGTGLNGRSSLRKVRMETGEVLQRIDLAPEFFGEGVTLLDDQIIQLTWQSQTGFIYNLRDFHLLRRFSYSGKGGA